MTLIEAVAVVSVFLAILALIYMLFELWDDGAFDRFRRNPPVRIPEAANRLKAARTDAEKAEVVKELLK